MRSIRGIVSTATPIRNFVYVAADKLPGERLWIATNAEDFIAIKNTDGEFHLTLEFDLKPDAELSASIRSQKVSFFCLNPREDELCLMESPLLC